MPLTEFWENVTLLWALNTQSDGLKKGRCSAYNPCLWHQGTFSLGTSVPWPRPFSYLHSRSLVFSIGGLLIQMFTQNNVKRVPAPGNTHGHWLGKKENACSRIGLCSMLCLVVCCHVCFGKANAHQSILMQDNKGKVHLFFGLSPLARMKRALEGTKSVMRVKPARGGASFYGKCLS